MSFYLNILNLLLAGGDGVHVSWEIPENLKQFVVIAPTKARLEALISVLLDKAGKVIVFYRMLKTQRTLGIIQFYELKLEF